MPLPEIPARLDKHHAAAETRSAAPQQLALQPGHCRPAACAAPTSHGTALHVHAAVGAPEPQHSASAAAQRQQPMSEIGAVGRAAHKPAAAGDTTTFDQAGAEAVGAAASFAMRTRQFAAAEEPARTAACGQQAVAVPGGGVFASQRDSGTEAPSTLGQQRAASYAAVSSRAAADANVARHGSRQMIARAAAQAEAPAGLLVSHQAGNVAALGSADDELLAEYGGGSPGVIAAAAVDRGAAAVAAAPLPAAQGTMVNARDVPLGSCQLDEGSQLLYFPTPGDPSSQLWYLPAQHILVCCARSGRSDTMHLDV